MLALLVLLVCFASPSTCQLLGTGWIVQTGSALERGSRACGQGVTGSRGNIPSQPLINGQLRQMPETLMSP
jgi:hypothetical protein